MRIRKAYELKKKSKSPENNGGPKSPGVFTVDNDRLTAAMRSSSLGTNTAIADFNGDTWNDIVKVEMHVTEILYNDGGGFFTILDSLSVLSETEVTVGDLNGDALPDLVITEEVTDRYFLNQGNGGDGLADFAIMNFPGSTSGFGGPSVIADVDGDGWNDVVIASNDIDLPGCNGIADVLRNKGNAPDVIFVSDAANLSDDDLRGVYDFAVFDIDGDGDTDLVVGRCNGTSIWTAKLPCPWDLDADGNVDISDLLTLLAAWGPVPTPDPPDFDGDGNVGITDFLTLLANWGKCP